MNDPSVQLLITNTNVKHELASGEYASRRAQCEAAAKILGVASLRDATAGALENARDKMDDVVFRRARHVIGEIERTVHAAEGIRASNWPVVGQLMYASHNSLRDDYEVSCKELDALVEIAGSIGIKGGIYGCRMTGGGFGGCTVALVKGDAVTEIKKRMAADYKLKTGIDATIFVSRPAGRGNSCSRRGCGLNRLGTFPRAGRFPPRSDRAERSCVCRQPFPAARVRCRSPRAATITPKTPSLNRSAHALPSRVAKSRSAGDGVPPRCT